MKSSPSHNTQGSSFKQMCFKDMEATPHKCVHRHILLLLRVLSENGALYRLEVLLTLLGADSTWAPLNSSSSTSESVG